MKPMTIKEVQRFKDDLGSLLYWHEIHQKCKEWTACNHDREESIVASLNILRSVTCTHLLECPTDESDYPRIVNALKRILAWHQRHLKDGCFLRTQGEDGQTEWLAATLFHVTQDTQYNDVIIVALQAKLNEANPRLAKMLSETMTQRNEELDDLLNEYVAASKRPDYAVLAVWAKRYPEHAMALMEFTVNWVIMEDLADNEAWGNEEPPQP